MEKLGTAYQGLENWLQEKKDTCSPAAILAGRVVCSLGRAWQNHEQGLAVSSNFHSPLNPQLPSYLPARSSSSNSHATTISSEGLRVSIGLCKKIQE
jgi:hypothetical protein